MSGMLEFDSGFWNIYIAVITIVAIVWTAYFLKSQTTRKLAAGEKAEVIENTWDGDLQEMNNPLPTWWLYLFYGTIVFSIAYLVLWPGLGSFKGTLGWNSFEQHATDVKEAQDKYGPIFDKFLNQDVMTVAKDPDANRMGGRLFATYCSQCHGSAGTGTTAFPNLTDADWLWGGAPDQIKQSIVDGRNAAMPALGAALGDDGVKEVVSYVLSLSGRNHDAGLASAGKAKFETNCAACHGVDGKGNPAMGAPNLTDKTWLYGGSAATIMETILKGRGGVMPAQKGQLDAAKIHLLAAYVWGLGGGQAPAEPMPATAPQAGATAAPEAAGPAQPAAQ